MLYLVLYCQSLYQIVMFYLVLNHFIKLCCSNRNFVIRLCLVHVKYFPKNKYFPEMLFSRKENVFWLFGYLRIHFMENQFQCLVRSNILQKMLFVLRKIKLCNQNRKNKRRENLINHSTASNGKVRVIQFNPIPHSHFPTNQTDPQKKQNLEKKIHQIRSN